MKAHFFSLAFLDFLLQFAFLVVELVKIRHLLIGMLQDPENDIILCTANLNLKLF